MAPVCVSTPRKRWPDFCPSNPSSYSFISSPYIPGALQAAVLHWSLEEVGLWASEPMHEPFRYSVFWSPAALCLSWMQSLLLVCTARCNPHSSRNLPILNHHTISVGPAHFVTSLLLPVSVWFLLYIVGYKHSIYLVFKWFSMMVILQFSFNIDVILGGDKHSLPSWLEVSMWLLYVLLDIWIPFGTKKRVVLKYIPFFKEQK